MHVPYGVEHVLHGQDATIPPKSNADLRTVNFAQSESIKHAIHPAQGPVGYQLLQSAYGTECIAS